MKRKVKRSYSVVEMAGYEGEKVVMADFKSYYDAGKWLDRLYTTDEVERLHVMIRADYADGTTEY